MVRFGRTAQAGRYAAERHRMLRRRWRRRILVPLALLVGPFGAGGLLLSWFADGWLRWDGGVLLGAFVAFFVAAWTTPPQHIENWATGAEGERRTARALRILTRDAWHVVHDLEWAGAGNIDHLVIGPGGVFVLDSKAWAGVVSVDDVGATVTPRDNPDAAWTYRGQRRRQLRATSAVARALATRSGRAIPVPMPVVVVWAPFPQRVATSGDVVYVDGDHLADWLHSRPRQLHREHVLQLADLADRGLLSGPTAATISLEAAPARR